MSKQSGQFDGRRPTSHERMTGQPWDASYHHGAPPWDIGRPQPAVVRLRAAAYAASVASVAAPGGRLHVLCFSDEGDDLGPHPVSRDELGAAFDRATGWNLAAVEPSRLVTRFHEGGASAWLTTIDRLVGDGS